MRLFVFPIAALTLAAAFVGLRAGQTPSETDIINRYAAAYMATATAGANPTDCAAIPHPDPKIRMVISCAHASGVTTTYFIGLRGAALPEPQGPSA